jgi:hypothetical protein
MGDARSNLASDETARMFRISRRVLIENVWRYLQELALARFPFERNRSNDKKSRQIKMLERVLIAKVCQLLRNSL